MDTDILWLDEEVAEFIGEQTHEKCHAASAQSIEDEKTFLKPDFVEQGASETTPDCGLGTDGSSGDTSFGHNFLGNNSSGNTPFGDNPFGNTSSGEVPFDNPFSFGPFSSGSFSCSSCSCPGDTSPLKGRSGLDRYIALALARAIAHMARNSLFYKQKLAPYADVLRAIEAFAANLSPATDSSANVSSPANLPAGTNFCADPTLPNVFEKDKNPLPRLSSSEEPGRLSHRAPSLSPSTAGSTISPLHEILSLIELLPFTTAAELADNPQSFLSIGQSDVAGLVSVPTSGTTGERKRVFCSDFDLERTVRFFRYGMRLFLPERQNQRVLLLMSGERVGSVGHLLGEALKYWSIPCDIYGFPVDMAACLEHIHRTRPSCIVGLPSHLMTLCRKGLSQEAKGALKTVLLSGEWASPTMRALLEKEWDCQVYIHYGLTESGLAGAVECAARQGCHIREADIYFSIVDSHGHSLPDGQWGEIVLTTLSRQATPLLKYKTGDWGRILSERCPCGSVLKRLEAGERLAQRLPLPDGTFLGFGDLDAALYALPWLVRYTVIQHRGKFFFAGYGGEKPSWEAPPCAGPLQVPHPHIPRPQVSSRHVSSRHASSRHVSPLQISPFHVLPPHIPPRQALPRQESLRHVLPHHGAPLHSASLHGAPFHRPPLHGSSCLKTDCSGNKDEAARRANAGKEAQKTTEPTFLELRLECLEPFTSSHWEACATALSAIPALRVIKGGADDGWEDGLYMPVILTPTEFEQRISSPAPASEQGAQENNISEQNTSGQNGLGQNASGQNTSGQKDSRPASLDAYLALETRRQGERNCPSGPAPMDKRRIYGVPS